MQFRKLPVVIMHHACYRRVHLCVLPPCNTFYLLCPNKFLFLFTLYHVLTYAWCPWLSLPYLAMYLILRHDNTVMTVLSFFWGIYGKYPADGCHPPSHLLIGPIDWYPASSVVLLPIHCLGTDKFIKDSWHASFSSMWPSLVPGSPTIFGSIYLARADSGKSGLMKCLQLLSSTPQNTCTRKSAPSFYS